MVSENQDLTRRLAEPFRPEEIKYKPQVVRDRRCMAIAYVDARLVQDRLDAVLGADGWQDEYEVLAEGSVVCRLKLRLGGEWVTKVDVGGPSEQPDEGDRVKAAFSDALKRAAVKFGVGRYLYRLESQWVGYDPKTKQIAERPKLPTWAVPVGPPAEPEPAKPKSKPKPAAVKSKLPADGVELHRRLRDYDADLHKQGLCSLGALLAHVTQAGVKAGHGADIDHWKPDAIELAVAETRKFRDSLNADAPKSAA